MELIKGRWYTTYSWRHLNGSNFDCFRFSHYKNLENGHWYFTECIDDNKYKKRDDWWNPGEYKFIEVDIEEIKHLLPKNHPDLQNLNLKINSNIMLLILEKLNIK